MFKKFSRWLWEARQADNVVMHRLSWTATQVRLVVWGVVLCLVVTAARAEWLAPDIDMAQGRACTLPRMEGELTLAVIYDGKLLCWVMR